MGVQYILFYPKDVLCPKRVLPYVEIQFQALSMRVINQWQHCSACTVFLFFMEF